MSDTTSRRPVEESVRQASLRRQSDDYLRVATQTASSSPLAATTSAYQAGYRALLAALTAQQANTFDDHPKAAAALLSAKQLNLELKDQVLAEFGAANYYSADSAVLGLPQAWLDWADRARTAMGLGAARVTSGFNAG